MSHYNSLLPSFTSTSLPAPSADFELEARLYAYRPLPAPPPPRRIKRKPLRPDARLVAQAAQLPMAWTEQDPAQDQEYPAIQAQGCSLSDTNTRSSLNVPLSPPPRSPLRNILQPTARMAPTPTAAQQRRSSQKVHQLTGIDIDVFDDSPWKYGNLHADPASDSSSVYSQDSTNNASTMKSWQTTTEEVPPWDKDQDGFSTRIGSWEPRSLPQSSLSARASLPVLAPGSLPSKSLGSLKRMPRTKRKSRDQPALDNYHRIVTDLASPTSTASDTPITDLRTAITSCAPTVDHSVRNALSLYDPAASSDMPINFHQILTNPRQAPQPPLTRSGGVNSEERLGSFFDFESDSDDEGLFSASGRGRDSFLGMLLGRGGAPAASYEDGSQRSRSVSRGRDRPSSELGHPINCPVGARASAGATTSTMSGSEKGGKRATLKGLVDWAKKDGGMSEEEKRRHELKQKITIQGGRRL